MNVATRSLLVWLVAVWALAVMSAMGVYVHAAHEAGVRLRANLALSTRIEASVQAHQLAELRLRADHLARDPAFVDYVAQSLIPNPARGNAIDSASIADLLASRRAGYDLAVVLTPVGKLAARSGTLLAHDAHIINDPAIGRAIASGQAQQEVRVEQGQIILVAVEPLLRGGVIQGVLYAARQLSNEFATEVGEISGTGIAMIATPAPDLETPPNNGLAPDVLHAIDAVLATLPAITSKQPHALGLSVDGQTLPAVATPLRVAGGHIMLIALDPNADIASAAVESAWTLWLGIAILAVIASAFALVRWRRTEMPLEEICGILDRGVHGDPELVIRTHGSELPRRLRDGINALLAQSSGRARR